MYIKILFRTIGISAVFFVVISYGSPRMNNLNDMQNEKEQCDYLGSNIIKKMSHFDLIQKTEDWPIIEANKVKGLNYIGSIPQKTDILSDVPRFYLYYHDDQDLYFLMITGGFSGNIIWKGPFNFTTEGEVSVGN